MPPIQPGRPSAAAAQRGRARPPAAAGGTRFVYGAHQQKCAFRRSRPPPRRCRAPTGLSSRRNSCRASDGQVAPRIARVPAREAQPATRPGRSRRPRPRWTCEREQPRGGAGQRRASSRVVAGVQRHRRTRGRDRSRPHPEIFRLEHGGVGNGVKPSQRSHVRRAPTAIPRPRVHSATGRRMRPAGCTSLTASAPCPQPTTSRSPAATTQPGSPRSAVASRRTA